MRTHGTLTKWNDERGFGFITPAQSGDEIFVHISEFPKYGGRPKINELISFETQAGPNGKLRAVRVMRPGQRPGPHRPHPNDQSKKPTGYFGAVLTVLAIAAIGFSVYKKTNHSTPVITSTAEAPAVFSQNTSPFTCDGRTMCSQMRSCAEARFFLKHCPDTRMDGNNDGEPCEQQWCH